MHGVDQRLKLHAALSQFPGSGGLSVLLHERSIYEVGNAPPNANGRVGRMIHAARLTGSGLLQPFQRQSCSLNERPKMARMEPVAIVDRPTLLS